MTLEDIFSETEDFGLPDLTPAQVEYAVGAALDAGVPKSFTFRSDKTIAGEAPGFEQPAVTPMARASTTSSRSTARPCSAHCSRPCRTPERAARRTTHGPVGSTHRLSRRRRAFRGLRDRPGLSRRPRRLRRPSSFITHRNFGYMFGWLTLVLLVVALVGRMPHRFLDLPSCSWSCSRCSRCSLRCARTCRQLRRSIRSMASSSWRSPGSRRGVMAGAGHCPDHAAGRDAERVPLPCRCLSRCVLPACCWSPAH